jgi:hypothetical protein
MIRNQTAWVQELIDDPSKTGLVVVSLAEEMPVVETQELLAKLPEAVKTPVLAIVANRIVDAPADREALGVLTRAGAALGAAAPAIDAALLSAELADDQSEHLATLRTLGPPSMCVPMLAWDRHDLAATKRIAAALGPDE